MAIKSFVLISSVVTALFAVASSALAEPALQVFKDCPDCPPMVRLPAMKVGGGTNTIAAEQTELTWRQYGASVAAGACKPPYFDYPYKLHDMNAGKLADDYPVTGVPLEGIECYVGWLKARTGRTYRLPTGAEWEFLARAGAQTRYPWGNDLGRGNAAVDKAFDPTGLRPDRSWLDDPRSDVRTGSVYPVGTFKPNAWGLYDVVGNASEATSERVPARPDCVARVGQARCVGVVARGGDILLKSTADPFETRIVWIAASPSWGIRLVRD